MNKEMAELYKKLDREFFLKPNRDKMNEEKAYNKKASYINSLSDSDKLELVKQNCYYIINIFNPSEEMQMAAVSRFEHYDHVDDAIVNELIIYSKAKELYKKLKNIINIIK